jgi:hypothetical protein
LKGQASIKTTEVRKGRKKEKKKAYTHTILRLGKIGLYNFKKREFLGNWLFLSLHVKRNTSISRSPNILVNSRPRDKVSDVVRIRAN